MEIFKRVVQVAFSKSPIDGISLTQDDALKLLELYRKVGTDPDLQKDHVRVPSDWVLSDELKLWAERIGFAHIEGLTWTFSHVDAVHDFEAAHNLVRSQFHRDLGQKQRSKVIELVERAGSGSVEGPVAIDEACQKLLTLRNKYGPEFGVGPFFKGLKQLIKEQLGRRETAVWKFRGMVFFQGVEPFADLAIDALIAMKSIVVLDETQDDGIWVQVQINPAIDDTDLSRLNRALPASRNLHGAPTGTLTFSAALLRPSSNLLSSPITKTIGSAAAFFGSLADAAKYEGRNRLEN